ncbi:MAG TPA: hypothetical protein V6D28_29795 [Leptolyngbyaceae cyanobacterium]
MLAKSIRAIFVGWVKHPDEALPENQPKLARIFSMFAIDPTYIFSFATLATLIG